MQVRCWYPMDDMSLIEWSYMRFSLLFLFVSLILSDAYGLVVYVCGYSLIGINWLAGKRVRR
jgi:hypothetical protein